MDGARHRSLRALVQAGFSPRTVRHLEDGIRGDVDTILDDLEGRDSGDFVQLVAKQLPLMTIMRMLGVPEEDRERLVYQADSMVSWNDPDFVGDREPLAVIGEAIMTLHSACLALCEERRRAPGDDLLSSLVQAEVDGERLTDAQIASFFVLLSVAGNDTTRHTTSHAMVALAEHPDQRDLLLADIDGRIDLAVEEFVRWASPVMTFRRTVVKPARLHGRKLAEGDKVVLFYPSGNRDERAIEDPYRFDVTRDPNRHLGFGGGGPHFCMGSALAKLQLKVLFGELLRRYPDLTVSEPKYLVGNFVNGVSALRFDRSAPRSPREAPRSSMAA
jgi:cytochrome P450